MSGSASLSPTASTGQSAQVNALATVSVQRSGAYSVYIKSNSQNLVGQRNSEHIIPGVVGSSTYANLPVNTWGYTAMEGSAIPDTAAYKAVSTTGNGDKITENLSNRILNDTKTIALSFVARVNDEKPADTYQNTITMSVISSPIQLALSDIDDLQQMATPICDATPMYEAKQLKDTRDGKYYWVSKLVDGHCWMTQNLDLDLSTSRALTSEGTDLGWNGTEYPTAAKEWTPGFSTVSVANSNTANANSQVETRSWSLGNVRIVNPKSSSDCGYPKSSATDCSGQFAAYSTPTVANNEEEAHYILGNHYQWNTATAGTGGVISSGQATDSICPRNWRLPEANTAAVGGFPNLITAGSIGNDVSKLAGAPYYFVRGGFVDQKTSYLFRYAGNYGYYWSSTPYADDTNAYNLNFSGSGSVLSSNYNHRRNGSSVRCVAR